MTQELNKLREEWRESQEFVDIVEMCIDDGAKEEIAREFADRIADWWLSRLSSTLEDLEKEVEEAFKGHGIKLPNHPHNDDISFFNYTPTGIYNKALQDVLTLIQSKKIK